MELPDAQRDLWIAYVELERQKVRSKAMPALERFIVSLRELPATDWHAWALDIAQNVVDRGADLAIRFSLFRSVLFPALRAALVDAQPGAARWLAGFNQLLYQSQELRDQLPAHHRTEIGLLRTALVHDPHDDLARRNLIAALSRQLARAIHETPSGVLWGGNGASIDQCAELRNELDEFCRLTTTEGVTHNYQQLIDQCRLHFQAYPRYLADRRGTSCYAEYLSQFHDP